MKMFISILTILAMHTLFAQNQNQTVTTFAGASTNVNGLQPGQEGTLLVTQGTFSKILGLNILEFDDLIFAEASVEGSSLLFEDWKQSATFYTADKRYRINGVNYDLQRESFIAKMSKDSLFTFDANLFDKAVVGGKTFITHGTNNAPDEVFELIFDGGAFQLVKRHSMKLKKGNPNPMLGQTRDKIIKQQKYLVLRNGRLSDIKLKKRTVLELLSPSDRELAESYANEYRKSFRNEDEVQQILNYVSNQD